MNENKKPEMIIYLSGIQQTKQIHKIIHEMEKEHSANYTLKFQITI